MTELEALRYAASGKADYITDRTLTDLGRVGMWELVQVGTQQVEPYVMQGGFWVTEWPTFRSRLTPLGEQRLHALAPGDGPTARSAAVATAMPTKRGDES